MLSKPLNSPHLKDKVRSRVQLISCRSDHQGDRSDSTHPGSQFTRVRKIPANSSSHHRLEMDCPECFQNFDEKLRRPKALPCGHTFCLDCLQKEDKCFEDRKTFEKIPIDLPDCHNLLSIMRSIITTNSSENTLNVWCNDCEDQATDNCVDGGHQVTSTKTKKFQDALKKLSKSGNELDFSFLHKTYDSLDEDAKSEVKEIMQGRLIPTDILLIGGNKRWSSSIKLPSTHEDENVDLCLYLLSLLRAKGIIPKDCLLPAKNPDTSIDDVDQEDGSELDLTNISSCKNQESMEEEKKVQLFSDKLLNVKRVKGLDCDNDSDWCLQILQRLAPSLEEAHLFNFHVQHLDTIYSMPQLRWLVLENLIGKKNNTGYELPTSVHPGKVEFLWMNIHDDKLSKSIVTSLQQSLRTVFIHVPFYHADAIEFFDGLDLPSLQLLMYGSRYCDSDNCSTIMTGLRKKFPGKKIFCFCCGRTELFDD